MMFARSEVDPGKLGANASFTGYHFFPQNCCAFSWDITSDVGELEIGRATRLPYKINISLISTRLMYF
jgi:hypothetical protein